MMKGRRQIILIPCWAQISPSGAPVVAISCKQGLRLIVLHRLIACREVEAHKPADLHKRQNAAAHQLINVPDTALEMPGNFQFVQPLDSGQIDVFFGLHKIRILRSIVIVLILFACLPVSFRRSK